MKKRNILKAGLICLAFMGITTTVEAKNYTTYKVGDEITVNLNDTLKEKFYIIEDNSESVKAIYTGSLGESVIYPKENNCTYEGSSIDEALKQRTSTWTNASNITLPTVTDIVGTFDYTSTEKFEELAKKTGDTSSTIYLKNLTNVPFYALNITKGSIFYTNTVANFDTNNTNCAFYTYKSNDADISVVQATDTSGSIRPIITVSKDNIVGGTYLSQEEISWNNFVEAYKNTWYIKFMQQIGTVNVTSTSNSLKVEAIDNTAVNATSWTTNFTYDDGVITYVPSSNEDNSYADYYWVYNCIYAIEDLKKYDSDKVNKWLNEVEEFTLINDGIEFKLKEYKKENTSSSGATSAIIGKYYTSFKLDVNNGLKSFSDTSDTVEETKKEEVINNIPDTGLNTSPYIYATALICLFTGATIFYVQLKKRKKQINEN